MLQIVNELAFELRFALRQLRKSPGFAATVVGTLALGITAATVLFSVVDAVLLRPLPLPEPDRLIALDTLERIHGSTGPSTSPNETSYPNFFDWRSENKSFSSMASYTTNGLTLGGQRGTPARRISGAEVSSDFFSSLGVAPALGRGFTRSEELPGSRSVVLSHSTWQTEFAADPTILGKTITLSDNIYTVIGVMPPGFAFPILNTDIALWTTFAIEAEGKSPSTQQRGWNQLSVVARLRPGVSLPQAKAEMDSLQQSLAARYPDEDQNETNVSAIPVLQDLVSEEETPLRILFAAVCSLLLIVCANVAGLLLTRASQRRGELAIRSALGASRLQLLRQLLLESTLLSLAGGLVGIAATSLLLQILPGILPADLPRVHDVALNTPVLAFAVGLSLLTGLLFGVLPAWLASKQDPALALAESTRSASTGRRHYRLQSTLVIAQTAISLVLLVAAGLLIRSFDRILNVDPGFDLQKAVTFRIGIPDARYSHQQQVQLYHQLLPALRALPGVQSATAAYPLPMTGADINISFSIGGRPTRPSEEPSAPVSLITSSYFETLRIPLKQGRFFLPTEHNEKGPPVVIVSEAFARRFFPGSNPIAAAIGQHMRSGVGIGDTPPMREIVGVVGNVKRHTLTEPDRPQYYIPYEQGPIAAPAIALRVNGDPSSFAPLVQSEVARIDSGIPIYRFQAYSDELRRTTAQQKFQTLLLTAFAAGSLLLAALGLYSILSYMVAQRTTELGLRIALGAQRSNILQLMLFRGLRLSAVGLALGIAVSILLTRFVANLLFGIKPFDALTFAVVTLILLSVSCAASLIPAVRAAMLDPSETLRNQ